MLAFLSFVACMSDSIECSLESTLDYFAPSCDGAQLGRYDGESRLFVQGEGGVLVLYLPEELEEVTYGGTSGNPLIAMLTLDDGSELSAFGRNSWATFGAISEEQATLRLALSFDDGDVMGPLTAEMEWRNSDR